MSRGQVAGGAETAQVAGGAQHNLQVEKQLGRAEQTHQRTCTTDDSFCGMLNRFLDRIRRMAVDKLGHPFHIPLHKVYSTNESM